MFWVYRTSTRTTIRETLFSLTYGCEAILPIELGNPNYLRAQDDPGFD